MSTTEKKMESIPSLVEGEVRCRVVQASAPAMGSLARRFGRGRAPRSLGLTSYNTATSASR